MDTPDSCREVDIIHSNQSVGSTFEGSGSKADDLGLGVSGLGFRFRGGFRA